MFRKNTADISATLMKMHDQARVVCNHNHTQMARQMAEWMAQDRRFDHIQDKVAFAADAMDARSHGRTINV